MTTQAHRRRTRQEASSTTIVSYSVIVRCGAVGYSRGGARAVGACVLSQRAAAVDVSLTPLKYTFQDNCPHELTSAMTVGHKLSSQELPLGVKDVDTTPYDS